MADQINDSKFHAHWDAMSHDYGFGDENATAYKAARAAWFAATPAVPAPALTRYAHHLGHIRRRDDGEFVRLTDVEALLAASQSVPAPDVGGLIPEQQASCDAALRAAPASQHDASAESEHLRDLVVGARYALRSIADGDDGPDKIARYALAALAKLEDEFAARFRAEGGITQPDSSNPATNSADARTAHPLADEHGCWGLYAETVLDGLADAEQAKLDSAAQAGLADALRRRGAGGPGAVAVEQVMPEGWLPKFEELLEDYVGAMQETAVFNATQRSGTTVRMAGPRFKKLMAHVQSVAALPVARNPQAAPDDVSRLYGWLVRASTCGLPAIESAARTMKDYYEGAESIAIQAAPEATSEQPIAESIDTPEFHALADAYHCADQGGLDVAYYALVYHVDDYISTIAKVKPPLESVEQMGGAQVASREQRAQELDDRYRKGYSEGWTEGRSNLVERAAAPAELSKRLREYAEGCAFVSAELLMTEAADEIDRLATNRAAEGEATSERKPLTPQEISHLWYQSNFEFKPFAKAVEQHHGIGSDK